MQKKLKYETNLAEVERVYNSAGTSGRMVIEDKNKIVVIVELKKENNHQLL